MTVSCNENPPRSRLQRVYLILAVALSSLLLETGCKPEKSDLLSQMHQKISSLRSDLGTITQPEYAQYEWKGGDTIFRLKSYDTYVTYRKEPRYVPASGYDPPMINVMQYVKFANNAGYSLTLSQEVGRKLQVLEGDNDFPHLVEDEDSIATKIQSIEIFISRAETDYLTNQNSDSLR